MIRAAPTPITARPAAHVPDQPAPGGRRPRRRTATAADLTRPATEPGSGRCPRVRGDADQPALRHHRSAPIGHRRPHILGAFAVAIASGVAFVVWELHVDQPMLDLSLTRDLRFSSANIAIGSAFFAMFGVFFLLTQYLQVVMGYSPLEAGIRTLPMAGGLMIATPMSARIVERFGTRRVVGTGLLVTASGLLMASAWTRAPATGCSWSR